MTAKTTSHYKVAVAALRVFTLPSMKGARNAPLVVSRILA
jgi:hypothetical protein